MWEYRVEIVDISGPYNTREKDKQDLEMKVMRRLGDEGWELVFGTHVRGFVGSQELRLYFKRRKA